MPSYLFSVLTFCSKRPPKGSSTVAQKGQSKCKKTTEEVKLHTANVSFTIPKRRTGGYIYILYENINITQAVMCIFDKT